MRLSSEVDARLAERVFSDSSFLDRIINDADPAHAETKRTLLTKIKELFDKLIAAFKGEKVPANIREMRAKLTEAFKSINEPAAARASEVMASLKENTDDDIARHKNAQFEIIKKSNPADKNITYSTWIRKVEDIRTFEEALSDSDYEGWENNGFDPYYTGDMAKSALENGKIRVFSSYPVDQGSFVTPSRMEALNYSGNGKVYSKIVSLSDVAWIDPTQGMYAKVKEDLIGFDKNDVNYLQSLEAKNVLSFNSQDI